MSHLGSATWELTSISFHTAVASDSMTENDRDAATLRDAVEALVGREIVIDVTSPFVFAGTLVEQDHRYLVLESADVHDLRDTNTTRELYLLDTRRYGIRTNRERVLVRRDEIVSISALEDVLA